MKLHQDITNKPSQCHIYIYMYTCAIDSIWQSNVVAAGSKDNADRFLFHTFLDLSLVVMKPVSLVPKMKDAT